MRGITCRQTLDAEDVTATSWKDKAVPSTADAIFGGSVFAGLSKEDSATEEEIFAEPDIEIETAQEDIVEEDIVEGILEEDSIEDEDVDALEDESEDTPNSEKDEDLNLVKSLLADLMDEETSDEEIFDEEMEIEEDLVEELIEIPAQDEDLAVPESILDEILEVNIEDEILMQDEAETILTDDDEPESELAKIARKARAAAMQDAPLEPAMDEAGTVEWPESETAKEFSILAGVAASAAGIGLAGALSSDEGTSEEISSDDDIDIAELVAETEAEISETITPETIMDEMAMDKQTNQTQEKNPMVRIVKTETLLGDDTEKDTTDAFASLSDVVQEKAELAENGPAIGELVQEALKPMLQEWLDKNLKGIVTRAVTKEIKRISSTK